MLIVSNRLPVNVKKFEGSLHFEASVGGLATGLSSFVETHKSKWIGWPGIASDNIDNDEEIRITQKLKSESCFPVFLSRENVEHFYHGFCNKTIWPLFHYFPMYTVYEEIFWKSYEKVNQLFCDAVVENAKPNDTIWIQDYQLMLLPRMLREKVPDAKIGFFMHIPFPSFELFRLLPYRVELLKGILGSDLVGFHTYDYVRHFLSSASRITGFDHEGGTIKIDNRIVKVDAFPMGIDYERYSKAVKNKQVVKNIADIRKQVGDRKIIIAIDRLDYTKGIIQRLEAFDLFLCENPKYKEKVTLILLTVPSRTGVEDYMKLRRRLEWLVGRINGEHGSIGWVPIWYLYRAVPFERLIAMYSIADVALVTPLRDGMNLIAKEYVATKTNGRGSLILSEMAGAANELGEAIIVNANDKASIVGAIKEAIETPFSKQIENNRMMQQRLRTYDITRWANDFLDSIDSIHKQQKALSARKLRGEQTEEIIENYKKADRRLFLLDYDGTLVRFVGRPEQAAPDIKLKNMLRKLAQDKKNQIVIISGRDKTTLDNWLKDINVSIVAEHGAWLKRKDRWTKIAQFKKNWKKTIRPILDLYTDRTPGSSVEEKNFSLVWHFRRAEPTLASVRCQDLKDTIINLTKNLGVGVYEGSKIIEIKNTDINKGRAAQIFLGKRKWDFIFSAGDDYTDEDLFNALPKKAWSFRVGYGISKAQFNLDSVEELRLLLENLLKSKYKLF